MPFPWLAAATAGSAILGYAGSRGQQRASAEESAAARRHADQRYEHEMRMLLGNQDYARMNNGQVGLDDLGRYRDRRESAHMFRQSFALGAEQGLTPQEIAGSPVPGGMAQSGGGASLGNNQSALAGQRAAAQDRAADRAAQMRIASMQSQTELAKTAMQTGVTRLGQQTQERGQDVQMSVAELQSATQQITTKMAAEANITSSSIIASATKYAARMSLEATKYTADTQRLNVLGQLSLQGEINDAQIAQISAQTGLLLQDQVIKNALHQERWARLFSAMGSENVVTSALAAKYGLPLEQILKGENISPELLKDLQSFSDEVLARSSFWNRESEGVTNVITEGIDAIRGSLGIGR